MRLILQKRWFQCTVCHRYGRENNRKTRLSLPKYNVEDLISISVLNFQRNSLASKFIHKYLLRQNFYLHRKREKYIFYLDIRIPHFCTTWQHQNIRYDARSISFHELCMYLINGMNFVLFECLKYLSFQDSFIIFIKLFVVIWARGILFLRVMLMQKP